MIYKSVYHAITNLIEGAYCLDDKVEAGESVQMLEKAIIMAGDGDHLDIGTLCGGSAIAAAMFKQHYMLRGDVYTIDPYDYSRLSVGVKKQLDNIVPSAELTRINAEMFGVENMIKIIQGNSDPLPVLGPFASVYIDGDHVKVRADWNNVRDITTKVVLFDDYNNFPEIRELIEQIREQHEGEWKVETKYGMAMVTR
jgi:hypothetical protein